MILSLRIFFTTVLVSMLAVTFWASNHTPLWKIPSDVSCHPWFIACLFDAYWGFLTFYCWVAYRERSIVCKIGWLIGILLLGNIAMASYMLILLLKLPSYASPRDILLRPALK